jgi:hypothetical protein
MSTRKLRNAGFAKISGVVVVMMMVMMVVAMIPPMVMMVVVVVMVVLRHLNTGRLRGRWGRIRHAQQRRGVRDWIEEFSIRLDAQDFIRSRSGPCLHSLRYSKSCNGTN